ncbi:MAG: glycosyltransferase [Phycisphaerae bacterium]|nr:glycosyltransferase family 4 protein [Phycisphaerae bacterium]NIP54680.1 glycosyltransferase family 4 protein [Phycisphaerae bacterium]NIU11009.1 glycosyltransferase family 4 protein [Phycisphaerae bacterium]NIU58892.1 glycosyltransferase [Phycisphaerae bacterium]NIW95162.1 glycosyltransferase [Phycisphaerae bacterium]
MPKIVSESDTQTANMKILHVGPLMLSHASGLPESILGFASAQIDMGLKVGLLSPLPLIQSKSMKQIPSVCLLGSPHRTHYNPWIIPRDWIRHIRNKFGTPDLVNFHSTYIPFNIALARRCRQVSWRYVITAHGVMGCLAQNTKRIKKRIANLLFFRSYVKHAEAIHAFSASEAKEIQKLFKVKKIIIVPNGVEDYFLEASEKLSPADLGDFGSKGDLMLGFIGRIDVYHKGLDLLLNALKLLKSQMERPICNLFVIGPFHTKKDERSFCRMVESLGLKDNVKLLGAKYGKEKLRYFLACDIFVHTSRFEGMPMSVLEAMALGRTCLVTAATNVSDIVCEGGGWACKPDSISIAETIKSIYEQRDSLKALGRQSHELIQTRFTWTNVAQKLYQEHSKLCCIG